MAAVLLVGIREPRRAELIAALEQAGQTVIEAPDAAAAAEVAAARPPDLVLVNADDADAGALARLARVAPDQVQALRDHEDDIDFAMSVARIGVSYRQLDSTDIVISRSLARLLGLAEGTQRIGRADLLERIHPDDVEGVRTAVADAIARGSEFRVEYRWQSPHLGWRWFRSTGRVSSRRPGRPAQLFTSIADVTERRSLEHQLQQVQKLEAIGQLAGGVAHDFNNLLTAIGGYASLLLDAIEDPQQRGDVEEILKASKRAAGLTRQLLAFSRKQVMAPAVLDVNALIEDMATMLGRVIGEDIHLTTRLTAEGATVLCDRSRLEQVLLNLVVNARDATGSHGTIRLETGVVSIDDSTPGLRLAAKPGTYVTFSVTDAGHGMTDETKARLFEPFFTTKPRGQGTGLGLATVYGIVAQSGGTIEVTSEAGAGSTFTIYLPRHERTAPAPRPHEEALDRGGTETILLAEDEAPVRTLARVILERAGYTVVEAASAAEAEQRSAAMPRVDLLLTDVVMPGGTGPELFHKLSAKWPALRVLFMSGFAEQDLFDRAEVEHGGAFLSKPFSPQELISRVRETLDKQ